MEGVHVHVIRTGAFKGESHPRHEGFGRTASHTGLTDLGSFWSVVILILGLAAAADRVVILMTLGFSYCSGGCDLWRKPDALRGVAGGDLRPPGTGVFDGSRPQQVQPHARSQMGRFVEHDEDSSKPDMLINRLSSGATRADLPARRSVSSRHSGGDSAVSARSEAPARCPVVECQNRWFFGGFRNRFGQRDRTRGEPEWPLPMTEPQQDRDGDGALSASVGPVESVSHHCVCQMPGIRPQRFPNSDR